ncbi:ABC transporter permease [Variovorax paradoxus]|uniref:ABC transporter permease n=1 Tax=Variovorax paradoxus TaxID=34073 RepID=UPI003D65D151
MTIRRTRFSKAYEALVLVLLAWILLPMLAIVCVSFGVDTLFYSGQGGLTLRWYLAAWEVGSFRSGIRVSAIVATCATAIATVIGIAAAIGLSRTSARWASAVTTVLLLPILVPGLVIGIGMLALIAVLGLDIGYGRLIAGHVLIVMPYVLRTTYASLVTQGKSLEEAARTLGAGEWRILFRITLPIARPGIIAGMLFAFILSLDEVALSLFLVDARTTTLPLAVLSYMQFNFDPAISAISAAQVILTVIAAVCLERLFGLKNLYGAERGGT